jgi:DNA repair protein RecO (recombination protein O)
MFLSEVLSKTLKEESGNSDIFEFIYSSLVHFDNNHNNVKWFCPWFLIHMTDYMGIQPLNNFSKNRLLFDYQEGQFTGIKPSHPFFAESYLSNLWSIILHAEDYTMIDSNAGKNHRNELLQSIITFYRIHFDNLKEIKSFDVLKEVFV